MPDAILFADILQHGEPQMRGHFRIRQCPVERAAHGQPVERDQGAQLVVGRVRVHTARRQHGAGERARIAPPDTLTLGVEKALIEGGVVRHQIMASDEIGKPGHDRFAGWRGAQHVVGDAGIVLNESTDAYAGIHQGLKAVGDLARLHSHRADFDGAIAHVRRQAAGLEVENNDRVGRSALALLHRASVTSNQGRRASVVLHS